MKGRRRNSVEKDALVGRGASGKYGSKRKPKLEIETPAEVFFPGAPPPPKSMTAEGAGIWRSEIGPTLKQVMLQPQGYPIFEMYCEALAEISRQRKAIADKGGPVMTTPSGYDRKRPEVDLLAQAQALVVKLSDQLNLSPKSYIASTATRAGQQLDMFASKGSQEQAPNTSPATANKAPDAFDEFVSGRPTVN